MFCFQNHSRIFQAIKCVFLFDKSLNLVSSAPVGDDELEYHGGNLS